MDRSSNYKQAGKSSETGRKIQTNLSYTHPNQGKEAITMTENLSNISELRDAMNNLYPFMAAYYKIKRVVENLEQQQPTTQQ